MDTHSLSSDEIFDQMYFISDLCASVLNESSIRMIRTLSRELFFLAFLVVFFEQGVHAPWRSD